MNKVVFLCLLFLVPFVSGLRAQQNTDSTSRMKFYYYPSSNVYFNPSTSEYWYYDEANRTWMSGADLPATIHLVKTPRYMVYHNDQDVWKDNAMHLKKYKVKKNGEIKAKPKKT